MRVLFWLLSLVFRLEIIERDNAHYLWRWHLLKTPFFGLYLHRFLRGDEDPDPHCHPWPFWTMVLRGGYYDEQWVLRDGYRWLKGLERCKPGRIYRRPATHIHRVRIPEGKTAWTLVMLGRRQRTWGFYTRNGFVHHAEYNDKATK